MFGQHAVNRFQSADARHGNIHHQYIRRKFLKLPDSFFATAGFACYIDIAGALQQQGAAQASGLVGTPSLGQVLSAATKASDNASSALVMTLPARKLTLVLMANSDRLVKPFSLAAGDVQVSPFGKLFLSFFAR